MGVFLNRHYHYLGIADINGKTVVKYKYDAWGTISIKEDVSSLGIWDLNPFRHKGYYYDKESKMYYCKTRYYVPLWGRWLNADSPKNIVVTNSSIINYYGYCSNNPVNFHDQNGTLSWGDLWNDIKNFFVETIGTFVEITANIVSYSVDLLFVGYETGTKSNVVLGDDSKPISSYSSHPFGRDSFLDWMSGLKVSIGDFYASISNGVIGTDMSFGLKNSSVDIRIGCDRIGIGTTYEQNGISHYQQFYINTIPTLVLLAAIVACAHTPVLIPLVGLAIASMAQAH